MRGTRCRWWRPLWQGERARHARRAGKSRDHLADRPDLVRRMAGHSLVDGSEHSCPSFLPAPDLACPAGGTDPPIRIKDYAPRRPHLGERASHRPEAANQQCGDGFEMLRPKCGPSLCTPATRWLASRRGEGDKVLPSPIPEAPLSQSDNRALPWSRRQRPKDDALFGPRFVGINLQAQPTPEAAIELVKAQEVVTVATRTVACDGGGLLGHPKIFINLVSPSG